MTDRELLELAAKLIEKRHWTHGSGDNFAAEIRTLKGTS